MIVLNVVFFLNTIAVAVNIPEAIGVSCIRSFKFIIDSLGSYEVVDPECTGELRLRAVKGSNFKCLDDALSCLQNCHDRDCVISPDQGHICVE